MMHTFLIVFLALLALFAVAGAPELAPDVRRFRRSLVRRPGVAGARPAAFPPAGRHSATQPRRSVLGPDPAPPWTGWGPAR